MELRSAGHQCSKSIDASREDGSVGRFVSNEPRRPNCMMKKTEVDGNPHLCLFALRDIKEGEEIIYDYGCEDCPWRTQMTACAADATPVELSDSALMSETQKDEPTSPHNTQPMQDTSLEDSELSEDESLLDTTSESDDTDANLKPKGTTWQSLDDELTETDFVNPPVCDATTPDQVTQDSNSIESEVSGAEKPRSSKDTTDSIVVRASQKRKGNRVYNKRHYCLYCCKPYAKMARHLESAHEDESDVAKALSFPKSSMERKKQLDYIRNRGNYAHNSSVMESGNGELVPCKRPPKEAQGNDFMHCAYCRGLFTRKVLWRHMRSCKLKPGSVTPKPGKNRIQSLCAYTGPVPSHLSKRLWGVICAMNPDSITDIIKNDHVIIDVGQHLLNKGGMSPKNQQYVREKMREMGRLIDCARRFTTLKTMEDLVNPKNYSEMVNAVRFTCGYDGDTDTFTIPSLANKLGNALVKVSKLLKAQGLLSNDKVLVKEAAEFQKVHSENWNTMVSATALRNIAEAKSNDPTLIPSTEDVQKMHQFLSQMQDSCSSALSESPSTKAWIHLAKVCLTQTILLNLHREGNVASMPLSAFLSRDTLDTHQDFDWALSEVEKKLCRHFPRIVTRVKCGRLVPILLTPKMLCAFELLVKQREACGVLKDNCFMFASPAAMAHFRGSDCIRDFAKACGAKCPKAMTSTKLRKHAATLLTVLTMIDTEMDQLALSLGHDIGINHPFDDLPEKELQLAKISKVLMALEQGRLSEYHGKNLDEITIDPDETAQISNEEDGCREEGNCSSTVCGKARLKRTPWLRTEIQAVERHMNQFITSCVVPGKGDCEKCLRAEPEALKNRNWQNLKFYVYNRITAYKRKVQHKEYQ